MKDNTICQRSDLNAMTSCSFVNCDTRTLKNIAVKNSCVKVTNPDFIIFYGVNVKFLLVNACEIK